MVMLVLFKLTQVLRVPVLVILAMFTCVFSVCVYVLECLLGIPAQLYCWLDLGSLGCVSLVSVRLPDSAAPNNISWKPHGK